MPEAKAHSAQDPSRHIYRHETYLYTRERNYTHTHNLLPSSCSASLLIPPILSRSALPPLNPNKLAFGQEIGPINHQRSRRQQRDGVPLAFRSAFLLSAARCGPARFPHAVWGSPLTFHPCRREWGRGGGGGGDHPVGVLGGPLELGRPRGEGLSPEVDIIMVG